MSLLAKWLALRIVNDRPILPTAYCAPTIPAEKIAFSIEFEREEPTPAEIVAETEAGEVTQDAEDEDAEDVDYFAETRLAEAAQHRPIISKAPKPGPVVF